MPKVSITLAAYNAEKYLPDALRSVTDGTFEDFELIVVDDGSTDGTRRILSACRDPRLIAVHREHDYIGSLNCALHMARGEYIARMDADDLMHPDRLSMQVALMDRHPEVDVCTTWMTGFDARGASYVASSARGRIEHPLLHLLRRNDLYHPTAMVRRSFLQRHRLRYDADYMYAEDYKLWSECARRGAHFFVIPQCLHYYRVSEGQVSHTKASTQAEVSRRIQQEIAEHLIAHSAHPLPLRDLHRALSTLEQERLITHKELITLCCNLFGRTV